LGDLEVYVKELLEELQALAKEVRVDPSVAYVAGLVYLANSISAAGHEIADAIQCMGELDTDAMIMPFPRDEYGDD
jgi:hypothetical protein